MTRIEQIISDALIKCRLQVGSFDKRFIKDMQYWKDRDLSDKQKEVLTKLLIKYRRQIPGCEELLLEVDRDRFAASVDMDGGAIIILTK
jgi:hypothetical protein